MSEDPGPVAADGVALAVRYELTDPARPVLLLHGLGSTAEATWGSTGWFRALTAAGFGWLAPDLRGHGDSGKPHDVASYRLTRLIDDVVAVLDQAGLARVDLVGYSLGAAIGVEFAAAWPQRIGRLVLGGLGDRSGSAIPVQELLDHLPAGADRDAVVACAEAGTEARMMRVADVRAPVFLVAGDDDTFAGSIEVLGSQMVDARTERLPGRNHFNALSASAFKQAAVGFLKTAR